MTAAPATCGICGESESDRRLLHDCFGCGVLYHLNPYSNQPGKDCGDAVLGEELGLFYYCEHCLTEIDAEVAEATNATPRASSTAGAPTTLPPRPDRAAPARRYRRIDRP